jgi:HEAT repeat protein
MRFVCLAGVSNLQRQLFRAVLLLLILTQGSSSEAPETFAQALTRHNIALTKPALVMALRNPDQEVRWLAAARLAEIKAVDTLPEIVRAAEDEKETLTRVNIAAAATWLGSSEGLGLLKQICQDSTLSTYARLNAARNVFDKGDHACFSAVVDMMRPSADPDTRIGALYLLSQLHDRTEEESRRILDLLVVALDDPEIRMRIEACQGIRWLKDVAAVAPLREALGKEHEEVVRQQMQLTLQSLTNPR